MKRILATTALVMIMAGGVAYSAEPLGTYQAEPTDIRASNFIGQRIYAADTMPTTDTVAAGAEKDWDDVGEINEVVLGRDGQVKAVVLGVGGFLGMGEKDVAVPMQEVKFVKNGDSPSDFFLVVNANKESLTNAPAYVSAEQKASDQQAASNTTAAPAATTMTTPAADPATPSDSMAKAPADATATPSADTAANTMAPAANTDSTTTASTNPDNRPMLTRPTVTRDGYAEIQPMEITADKLTGARVYGPKDEDVGEINRIILDNKGQVDRVVLDVGGFLGMGERQIAVTMNELNIVKNADGSDFRVYIDANEANLKAQPEFKG